MGVLPTGAAKAQFSFGNLFSGASGNTSNNSSRPAQSLFSTTNVATPTQDTAANMRVGGSMLLNTSNATKNLMGLFNQNTSGTQLMGNRVIGYSEFPKEKDMPGIKTLSNYFHYRRPKPGGTN